MASFPDWNWSGWTWVIAAIVLLSLLQAGWHLRAELRRRAQDNAVAARQNEVRQTGRPYSAIVLRTTDTGIRMGAVKSFVIELALHVQGDTVVPDFDATVRVPLSPVRLADFTEGRTIQVRVDPATRDVAIAQRTE
ncbi:hypothetical protein [Bordetella genomosp. 9]|uniref:Uncharacterized protein n=1 Tax=Bordetella genomosp. 9 TaxID=1416803 RepID=A0A1W6Z3G6_9BORD|nr:hypothetical protein [Bordetella genomosp. 9]ARP87816.1 hypothetical protein CAL13_17555 [Bordetella genomosp. 9]